ncbi:MAG: CD225/dispanin family protein [Polyangiaceae bacterium]|nr:CD225/dispanin family protein [Polyangiaceae bacterium]
MSPYQPPGGKDNVDTAMVVSIVSLFACGGLFAIPAIVLAVQARDAKNRGDFAMAQAKAKQSLTAAAIAIGALVVIGIIFVVLSVVASAVSSTR